MAFDSYFDPIDMLRMSNLFPPPQKKKKPGEEGYQYEEEDPSQFDVANYYTPSNIAMQSYVDAANAIPARADYRPSKWRQFGAAMAGLGAGVGTEFGRFGPEGIKTDPKQAFALSSAIADKPFSEAVEDWQNKLKPLQAAAVQEEARNRNERIMAEQTVQRNINAARERRLGRETEVKLGQAQEKLRISDLRQQAYTFKIHNPNWLPRRPVPGGNLTFYNPANPSETYDTGWPEEKVGDADRIALTGEQRIKAAEAYAGAQLPVVQARTQGAIDVKETPPGVSPEEDYEILYDKGGKPIGYRKRVKTPTPQPPRKATPVVPQKPGGAVGPSVPTGGVKGAAGDTGTSKMPQGFRQNQRIRGKDGREGTLVGVGPDGKPIIIWDPPPISRGGATGATGTQVGPPISRR